MISRHSPSPATRSSPGSTALTGNVAVAPLHARGRDSPSDGPFRAGTPSSSARSGAPRPTSRSGMPSPPRRRARRVRAPHDPRLLLIAAARYGESVGHIELRDLDDDDLDAIFEMMRDPESVAMAAFTADDPDDRVRFDAWIARERSAPERVVLRRDRERRLRRHRGGIHRRRRSRGQLLARPPRVGPGRRHRCAASARLARAGAPAVRTGGGAQCPIDRGSHQVRIHRGLAQCRLRARARSRDRGDRLHTACRRSTAADSGHTEPAGQRRAVRQRDRPPPRSRWGPILSAVD